ncbi:MAG TPA: homoserine kinase [Planctomycetes bacterium]|nr:homoserine kinase [Planctomycetota bacterium]
MEIASGTAALRVQVPASTSNLGPGFDFLGLALSLYLCAEVLESNAGDGLAATPPRLEDGSPDLVRIAFERAAAELGLAGTVRLRVKSEIPIGRGFGSSGAAVAAGLLLANARSATPLPLERLLTLGLELEGHPDNVTASLVGGCTLCHPSPSPDAAHPVLIRQELHPSIGFALAWPADPLATRRAREALPSEVPFPDAADNPRRLALLLEGLRTGSSELLGLGGVEHLHEHARLPLIPGASRALEAAREAGAWLATLSGAGSGTVALGPIASMQRVADAMADGFRAESGAGFARVVEAVRDAPRVLTLHQD